MKLLVALEVLLLEGSHLRHILTNDVFLKAKIEDTTG